MHVHGAGIFQPASSRMMPSVIVCLSLRRRECRNLILIRVGHESAEALTAIPLSNYLRTFHHLKREHDLCLEFFPAACANFNVNISYSEFPCKIFTHCYNGLRVSYTVEAKVLFVSCTLKFVNEQLLRRN
jgi:hypothetical protein